MNVLDVAENSVKAGADLIGITVTEDSGADLLTIVIEDNGCGMTEEQVQRVIDPFYTTRTTRKVGLGVPFFKMAAEMTGGSFQIESKVNVGTRVTAQFGLTHIDRMPLGSMCETICTLVQCNPDIDFVYTHEVDKRRFTADTREFRQVLEGIPLNTPEVMAFLRDYITEHTQSIHGGATQS